MNFENKLYNLDYLITCVLVYYCVFSIIQINISFSYSDFVYVFFSVLSCWDDYLTIETNTNINSCLEQVSKWQIWLLLSQTLEVTWRSAAVYIKTYRGDQPTTALILQQCVVNRSLLRARRNRGYGKSCSAQDKPTTYPHSEDDRPTASTADSAAIL